MKLPFRIPFAGWLVAGPLPLMAQPVGPNPGVEPTVLVAAVVGALIVGAAVGYAVGYRAGQNSQNK